MTIPGIILGFFFIIWTMVTLIVLGSYKSLYYFIQSVEFILICVVYILLLLIYSIYKKMARSYEDEF